jgi:hypothetical protein
MNLPFLHALYLAIRENMKPLLEAKKEDYHLCHELTADERRTIDHFVDALFTYYRYARGNARMLKQTFGPEQKLPQPDASYMYGVKNCAHNFIKNSSTVKFFSILPKLVKCEKYAFFAKFNCCISHEDFAIQAFQSMLIQEAGFALDELAAQTGVVRCTSYHSFGKRNVSWPHRVSASGKAAIGAFFTGETKQCVDQDDKKYTKSTLLLSFAFTHNYLNVSYDTELVSMMHECSISFHEGMSYDDILKEIKLEINQFKKHLETVKKTLPKFHNAMEKQDDVSLNSKLSSLLLNGFDAADRKRLIQMHPSLEKFIYNKQ